MLTTVADIVFVVDESRSESVSHNWLASIIDEIHYSLATLHTIDVRYGLVGLGESLENDPEDFEDDIPRYAHSHIVNPDTNLSDKERLWGNVAAIGAAFESLAENGGDEDGWDALEHAIAEYPLRPGSIPMFILVQNDEGRIGSPPSTLHSVNESLTHDGVLAALRSKNAILNVMVAGRATVFDGNGLPIAWDPIFDLFPYGLPEEQIVLGVDADGADGFFDGQHTYYGFDVEEDEVPTPEVTISDALQISFQGSNTGHTGMVQTGKSILFSTEFVDGIGSLPVEGANPYRAKNVPFAPVDMTGTDSYNNFPITKYFSHSFQFFDTNYSDVYVHHSGMITLGTSSAPSTGLDLSLGGPSGIPLIAPFLQELTGLFVANIRQDTVDVDGDSTDDFVVEWNGYRYADDNGTVDPITFQAVLFGDGDIQFNYIDLDSYASNDNDVTVDDTGGIHATVGIWSGAADLVHVAAGKYVPGLHSPGGEVQTHLYGELRDSYIRMAWDTGGSAWDIGIVPTYADDVDLSTMEAYGVNSPEANELRDAFVESLVNQIIAADEAGLAVQTEMETSGRVLLALNVGSNTQVDAGDAGVFRADNGAFTVDGGVGSVDDFTDASPLVDVDSTNSIPAGTTAALRQIFSSARGEQGLNSDALESVALTIDKLDLTGTPNLIDDTYVVELFFAELGVAGTTEVADNRVFDVRLEGKTVLNDYNIAKDYAKIDTTYVTGMDTGIEYDSLQLGTFAGVVKRFLVTVSGNDGLQIELVPEEGVSYEGDPLLNGVRILKAGPELRGDYNGNGVVDMPDYPIWRNRVGRYVPTFTPGDGTGNGYVDEKDYLIWKNNFGATSSSGPSGTAPGMVMTNEAPKVVNVTASGSQSTHAPFSFDTVDGSGEQLRTIPVGRLDTISLKFSEDVVVQETDLDLVGMRTGHRPTVIDFEYDVMTMTATWVYEIPTGTYDYELILADNYALVLSDSVTDMEGVQLDGEWTNPASVTTTNALISEFPSGNGTAGGDFVFVMTIMQGDITLDNTRSYSDLNVIYINMNYMSSGATFEDGDFDGDGDVDNGDYMFWDMITSSEIWDLASLSLLADLDGDFDIDEDDETLLISRYSMSNPTQEDGDLNGDNVVDADDLDILYTLIGLDVEVVA